MAGLPKKYFKMFPGNLKAAWRKYKADKAGRGRPARKTATKKTGARTMAAKKTAKRAAGKAVVKFRTRTLQLKPVDLLIRALIAAGGGLASTAIVNNTPLIKNIGAIPKSIAQSAVGLGALYFIPDKFALIKMLGVGSFMAGVMGGVQKVTKMEVLAGDADLTDEEVQALLSAGYLQGPMQLAGPARMGAGEPPDLLGQTMNPAFSGGAEFQI